MTSSHAYIVSPLRTPIGKFGGSLSSIPAADLAAQHTPDDIPKPAIEYLPFPDLILMRRFRCRPAQIRLYVNTVTPS